MVEGWHGQKIDHPVAEMREYVRIVRAILRGEDPPAGEKWSTSFHLVGLDPRPGLPILIATLSSSMLTLAGEIGDGVMLWLCNPDYIRDVVVPAVRADRERASKNLEGFEVVAAVPAAISDGFLEALTAVGDEASVRRRKAVSRCRRHAAVRRSDPEDRLRGHAARRRSVAAA